RLHQAGPEEDRRGQGGSPEVRGPVAGRPADRRRADADQETQVEPFGPCRGGPLAATANSVIPYPLLALAAPEIGSTLEPRLALVFRLMLVLVNGSFVDSAL